MGCECHQQYCCLSRDFKMGQCVGNRFTETPTKMTNLVFFFLPNILFFSHCKKNTMLMIGFKRQQREQNDLFFLYYFVL